MYRNFIVSTLFSCLMLGAASAATITSETPVLADLQSHSLDLPAGSSWLPDGDFNSVPDIAMGSSPGNYTSPYQDLGAGLYENIPYWHINGPVPTDAQAILMFSHLESTLSFLWGTPEDHTAVTLINRAAQGGWKYLVVLLSDLGTPDPVSGSASLVTISGFAFDKVVFTTKGPAFEIAHIAAVPLPAGGLMLLMGLGGLALLRRRSAQI